MRDEVTIKRELGGKWHWLLRGADSHIINRSDTGFEERDACIADAARHGFAVAGVIS